MFKRPISLTLWSTAIFLAVTQPGQADEPGEPMVTARAFAPLPAGASVSVEPRDDSDANLQLRDLMAARLEGKLHPVLPGAALRLRFSTETVAGAGPKAGATTGEAVDASDRKSYTPSNLGYSEADRFFGGPAERDTGAIQTTYKLRATLERRDDAKVVWSGEATGALTDRNEARLAAALAQALADALGYTVETQVSALDVPAPRPTLNRSPTSLGALRSPGGRAATPLAALPELAERR